MMTMQRSSVAEPRWSTAPTNRPHRGELLAAIHRDVIGADPMPWQSHIYRVGSEYDPVTGIPAYREVIGTVPRQSGKSTTVIVFKTDRGLFWGRPQRMAYTAQSGWDARKKLIDDLAPMLQASPYSGDVSRVLRGAGNEAIIFGNGSRIDVLSSSGEAGHGRTLNLGTIDEAFADVDDRREQAMLPAMATVADAQLLIFSTAGDSRSVYLRRKVAAGRTAAVDGATEGIAYFEWSAPDDADPDDPAVWRACMPALGLTIDEAVVRHARRTMSDGEFRRAFLNQWVEGEDARVIPEALWSDTLADVPLSGRMTLAVDATPDLSSASIAVSGDGVAEVNRHGAGTSWALDELVAAAKKLGAPVVLDGSGPVGHFVEKLRGRGVRVVELAPRDVAYACAEFYTLVSDRKLKVRPNFCDHCSSVPVTAAVEGAQRQPLGDGWRWSRKTADVDVSPLMALTMAVSHRDDDSGPLMAWAD